MSERTLLPVIIPAKDAKSLPTRLSDAVCLTLGALGIEPEAIERERREMCNVRIGRTASRSALGFLNDLMFQLQVGLDMSPQRSLLEQALCLAETPYKPLDYANPKIATQALFASNAALAKAARGVP